MKATPGAQLSAGMQGRDPLACPAVLVRGMPRFVGVNLSRTPRIPRLWSKSLPPWHGKRSQSIGDSADFKKTSRQTHFRKHGPNATYGPS